MKNDWKKIIEQNVSDEARDRTFAAADRLLDSMQPERKASWLELLLSPAGGLSLAGAAAAVVAVVIYTSQPKQANEQVAAIEPEMIQNIEILMELETLEHWDPAAKDGAKQKWKKKSS